MYVCMCVWHTHHHITWRAGNQLLCLWPGWGRWLLCSVPSPLHCGCRFGRRGCFGVTGWEAAGIAPGDVGNWQGRWPRNGFLMGSIYPKIYHFQTTPSGLVIKKDLRNVLTMTLLQLLEPNPSVVEILSALIRLGRAWVIFECIWSREISRTLA